MKNTHRCAHETSADKQWTAHIAYIHATDPMYRTHYTVSMHVLHNRKIDITNILQKKKITSIVEERETKDKEEGCVQEGHADCRTERGR